LIFCDKFGDIYKLEIDRANRQDDKVELVNLLEEKSEIVKPV